MTENEIPPIQPLAPIADKIREIAQEELGTPQTMHLKLYDDGDYYIYVFHSMGEEEREQIVYDHETGAVSYQYRKGVSFETVFVSEEAGSYTEPVYDVSEERQLTTIVPPAE